MFRLNFIFIIALIFTSIYCNSTDDKSVDRTTSNGDFTLPPGFNISIYVENLPGARSMTLSPSGIIYIGSRSEGNVYALLDTNKDYKIDKTITLLKNLNIPNGVAFKNGSLFVAEQNRVLRFDNIEQDLNNPPQAKVVNDNFPNEASHGWKYLAFGPDNKLYVPVGAPCNVCLENDTRFASLMRMNEDGSQLEVYASGIRNTVGFTWHPVTNELWFTDNGRDLLGDNIPPDELNKAPTIGLHFGFPFIFGNSILDPDFGQNVDTTKFVKPVQELGPHVASLGLKFYTGNMFPSEYKNQIFIAEHGSWNRSEKIGYRVTMVKIDESGKALQYTPFIEGWLKNGNVSGRPVDILVLDDGSMLVSDDDGGRIYRVTYQ